jgi:hypothetical protein
MYHLRVAEVGIGGSEIVGVVDTQAGTGDAVERLVVEDVVVIDEGAKKEVENNIVAHIEVCFNIAHVVQGFDNIEPD